MDAIDRVVFSALRVNRLCQNLVEFGIRAVVLELVAPIDALLMCAILEFLVLIEFDNAEANDAMDDAHVNFPLVVGLIGGQQQLGQVVAEGEELHAIKLQRILSFRRLNVTWESETGRRTESSLSVIARKNSAKERSATASSSTKAEGSTRSRPRFRFNGVRGT